MERRCFPICRDGCPSQTGPHMFEFIFLWRRQGSPHGFICWQIMCVQRPCIVCEHCGVSSLFGTTCVRRFQEIAVVVVQAQGSLLAAHLLDVHTVCARTCLFCMDATVIDTVCGCVCLLQCNVLITGVEAAQPICNQFGGDVAVETPGQSCKSVLSALVALMYATGLARFDLHRCCCTWAITFSQFIKTCDGRIFQFASHLTHTHIHTHTYIPIYICVCKIA